MASVHWQSPWVERGSNAKNKREKIDSFGGRDDESRDV
jgi:hypothetical protein